MTAPPSFPADVDVAVVAHNGARSLPRVFACLRAAGVPPERVTLFDIASTDKTLAWARQEWPAIRIERFERNDGPNLARNRAIELSRERFLLLVDADAYLRPAVPHELRLALDTEAGVAMTVPVVVHDDRPEVVQYSGASLHFICEAINPWAERHLGERGTFVGDVGTAPGVTMLIDTVAATRVGRFDARYFMGKEDGEFCYRLRVAGYRIVETPHAVVAHGSRPRSNWLFRYQVRNRWHFMLKNYEARTLVVLAPALAVHEVLQAAVIVWQGEIGAWFWALRSLRRWLPSLAAERTAVAAMRVAHDQGLLAAAPLVVRADLTGAGVGRFAKRLYDGWLGLYWRVARRLLA